MNQFKFIFSVSTSLQSITDASLHTLRSIYIDLQLLPDQYKTTIAPLKVKKYPKYTCHIMTCMDLLQQFVATRTLKVDPQTKLIVLLGTIKGEDAIVSIEKTSFPYSESTPPPNLGDLLLDSELINQNDVYYWSLALLSQNLKDSAAGKINLVYPATQKHILKYLVQQHHMIRETPLMYETKVAPFIETQKGDRIQWVYNIIFKDKEAETFVHNDTDPQNGFVLLPDMKWDQQSMSSLYLVAIVRRTDISSMRDLDGSHVEYLEALLAKIKDATCKNYPVKDDELRIFVHYQPSYYHFHIHVVNIAHSGLGGGIIAGKAFLLEDIIDHLKMDPAYYKKKTLTYNLGELHPLWPILNN